MQVIIEKLIDLENKELYLIFIDYSKAFDKVDHGRLFDIMLEWTADSMVPYRTGHKTGLQRLTDRVQHTG